jgi:lysophospholipase L1-like esterase
MKLRLSILAALCAAAAATAPTMTPSARSADTSATYYLSLGDSLAASFQPNGDRTHGYAEQLYASLTDDQPKLRLVKLGCKGESTVSMRYGTQNPTDVLSCATSRGYDDLYRKGTQLAEAVNFLEAHRGRVALVTIDIGGNDLLHLDAHGRVAFCLLEPAGCNKQTAAMARNLTAILRELKAAAGPGVPIVGMTYDDVWAPLCVSDAGRAFACNRFDAFDRTLAATYAAARVPVADVAGAFENDNLMSAAAHVCAWTWFCTRRDIHPNIAGYGAIARAFEQLVPRLSRSQRAFAGE